jgi:excisionase family DNA binding protein
MRKRVAQIIEDKNEKPSFFADELFSVSDAARRLGGISPQTVRGWILDGKIKAARVGGRRMIRSSELQKMVRE